MMMKKLFTILILLLIISLRAYAQELPTKPAKGFSFPLGSKITIKLYPVDSLNFNYSIIEFEPFHEMLDLWGNDSLFSDTGKAGTVELYFCTATRGQTKKEREKNMKVLLISKNRSEYALEYTSEIQFEENGDYHQTSNTGWLPGVKSTEIWSDMIYFIGIRDIQKME